MRIWGVIGGGLLCTGCALGQTHRVEKTVPVVRAVGVYEWTGELTKPTASRLVPVSVFINRTFQDAGVYLARPIPFALENGTVFELEKGGVQQGTLELAFARHLQTPEKSQIDDGWFAYGAVKPKPADAPVKALKKGALPAVVASGGTGAHTADSPDSSSPAAGAPDRSTAAGAGTTVSAGPAQKTNNDGPTMRKRADDDEVDSAKDDPDRPTLKKRTPMQSKAAQKKGQLASVEGTGDLNDDPDRPNLHRGKPASRLEDEDLPPLRGVPADMHQMVAVSDAADRPEHDFTRVWESPAEQASVLGHLRDVAAGLVSAYAGKSVVAAVPAPAPVRSKSARRVVAKPVAAVDVFDPKSERVTAYTLSYGGAATFVFTAQTVGASPVFVLVVAQREPDGTLKVALSNVTDAGHLDRTPQLRLVDVVDPDGSNRAEFLFEMRGATTREFALYRVIGAVAESTIVAGNLGG